LEEVRISTNVEIECLGEPGCDEFFRYLNDHRSDNGTQETGYFMPSSRSDARFSSDKESSYRAGLKLPVGALGWRRAWVARATATTIAGHVDLWSHSLPFAEHRCLLGMGVDRRYRRRGVGGTLLAHAIDWTLGSTTLEWIDLHVFSNNERAIRLYLRAGFTKIGELPEMFKVDGHAFSDAMMTRSLREDRWHRGYRSD